LSVPTILKADNLKDKPKIKSTANQHWCCNCLCCQCILSIFSKWH